MSKLSGGVVLLMLALLMLLGFVQSGRDGISAAEAVAAIITVVLPGFFAIKLIRGYFGADQRVEANKVELRRRTLGAEMLRLAGERGGKLTIVEAVTEFAITPDEAKEVLDGLAREGMADFQVTDAGVVVYDFVELRRIADKESARGILE